VFGRCAARGRADRRGGVDQRIELCVELVDALDVGGDPFVIERAVVREGKGGAAEVGKGEVERVLELGLGVGRPGVCGSRERGCGMLAGGVREVAAERVQVEDLSVLARELA
jgi:hypothetical protein